MTTLDQRYGEGRQIRNAIMAGLLGYDESPGIKLAPDLRRIVDEALFGSVWQRPALGFKDRSICTISAMTALRHLTQLRQHISAGLHLGLTPDQIVEIFIQLTFYVGVPTVEDALTLASEVFEAEAIDFTPSVIYDTDRSVADLSDLGARSLLEHIGDATTYQTDDAESEEMQLDRLINEYHWGAIYTRPHLDAKSRAICALSAMTVLGHYDRQMRARIEGALRVGVKPSEIMELFIHLTLYGGYLTTRTSMLRIARSVFTEQGLQEPAGEREHRASTSST